MGEARIDLWWLPLGAGGRFVRINGRIYERIQAWREKRGPLELYHTALEVRVPGRRFVIENAWPIPDENGEGRGVVREGPVFHPVLGRLAVLRYEIRRWQDGSIPDAAWAVQSPQTVSEDVLVARRLLDLVPSVPAHVWGRRARDREEMWNSNSVISWLLARSGAPIAEVLPPPGGRAPGWEAGVAEAGRIWVRS